MNIIVIISLYPQLNDENDAEILLRFVNKIIEHLKLKNEKTSISIKKIDEEIVFNVSNYARAQITTSASFIGGVVAQEIIKFTGKFTPIYQWLYFDTFESLPEFIVNKHSEGSKYDDFISIYGSEILEKIQSKR